MPACSERLRLQNNHNVSIWRSKDMAQGSWDFVGNAVECEHAPDCQILYRPHMVWNQNTNLYVLFYNDISKTMAGFSRNGVATAPHPAGPWRIANSAMETARLHLSTNHNASVGDFDVLVDGDGSAYMVYSYGRMSIERLDDDYLNSASGTRVNATFPGPPGGGTLLPEDFVEAPSLWQRSGVYYLTTGHCCCFCWQGSGLIVYHAPHRSAPGPSSWARPQTLVHPERVQPDARGGGHPSPHSGGLARPRLQLQGREGCFGQQGAAELCVPHYHSHWSGMHLDRGPVDAGARWREGARATVLDAAPF